MPDREKVVKGLETCIKNIDRECPIDCPYYERCAKYEGCVVFQPVLRDALELLKKQEAVKPKIDAFRHPYCPKCKVLVYETWEFCPHCGQSVKWE